MLYTKEYIPVEIDNSLEGQSIEPFWVKVWKALIQPCWQWYTMYIDTRPNSGNGYLTTRADNSGSENDMYYSRF